MTDPDSAALLPASERQFRNALRRRNRWGIATVCSASIGFPLAFVGVQADSRLSLGCAGCALAATGLSLVQLTANGYIAPWFGEWPFGRDSARAKQYGAAFVLALWGIFCIVAALQSK